MKPKIKESGTSRPWLACLLANIHPLSSVVRASIGAMTTKNDVDVLTSFLQRFFTQQNNQTVAPLAERKRSVRAREEDCNSDMTLVSAVQVASIG